jgi:hypothetical protein
MTTRKQLDLSAIARDEARLAPFIAALEGAGTESPPGEGPSRDPQFTASGKNPDKATSAAWSPEFTASGKMAGKPTG